MRTVLFYSLVANNGDGSASVLYFSNETAAMKAYGVEERTGEHFSDGRPTLETLEFSDDGELLNPDEAREEYE